MEQTAQRTAQERAKEIVDDLASTYEFNSGMGRAMEKRIAAALADAERDMRERCAQVAEQTRDSYVFGNSPKNIAAAIRTLEVKP